jgi:hypothetical protein
MSQPESFTSVASFDGTAHVNLHGATVRPPSSLGRLPLLRAPTNGCSDWQFFTFAPSKSFTIECWVQPGDPEEGMCAISKINRNRMG